jgi:hypothetical protein
MYDYAGLLALEAAGGLTDESRLGLYPKRALVRGDSARVSRLIKANKVNWHYAWSDPAPKNVIIDVSGASCSIDMMEQHADASDSSNQD